MASPGGQEMVGPEGFLSALPPFDSLDDRDFSETLTALEVTYLAAGTRVLRQGGRSAPTSPSSGRAPHCCSGTARRS